MADGDRNHRAAGFRRANARAERRRVKHGLAADPEPDAPVVAFVPDDDPELAAAAAEAASRFPEFLAAFDARRPADTFAVKAPFADDYGREYMWVIVTAVDDTHVFGRLDNAPKFVRSMTAGRPVRVPRRGLNDWLYVSRGAMHGGFTVKVVEGRLRRNDAA